MTEAYVVKVQYAGYLNRFIVMTEDPAHAVKMALKRYNKESGLGGHPTITMEACEVLK